jgi:hypothetical protein
LGYHQRGSYAGVAAVIQPERQHMFPN